MPSAPRFRGANLPCAARRALSSGPGAGRPPAEEPRPARSDAGERVAPLPAARRKNSPPAFGFHACAESVRLVAAAHLGLKRPFRQRTVSSLGFGARASRSAPSDVSETASVIAASDRVKESSAARRQTFGNPRPFSLDTQNYVNLSSLAGSHAGRELLQPRFDDSGDLLRRSLDGSGFVRASPHQKNHNSDLAAAARHLRLGSGRWPKGAGP